MSAAWSAAGTDGVRLVVEGGSSGSCAARGVGKLDIGFMSQLAISVLPLIF